jgi:hypothetical protein
VISRARTRAIRLARLCAQRDSPDNHDATGFQGHTRLKSLPHQRQEIFEAVRPSDEHHHADVGLSEIPPVLEILVAPDDDVVIGLGSPKELAVLQP